MSKTPDPSGQKLHLLWITGKTWCPSEINNWCVAADPYQYSVFPTKSKLEKERKKIVNATPAMVDMVDWANHLNNMELSNKIGEFEGKIVELQLPVFVAIYLSDHFGIVTVPSDGIPGTYLILYPKNEAETDFIKSIKTGQMIKIRGKVKGTYLKRIKIEPAFLI